MPREHWARHHYISTSMHHPYHEEHGLMLKTMPSHGYCSMASQISPDKAIAGGVHDCPQHSTSVLDVDRFLPSTTQSTL